MNNYWLIELRKDLSTDQGIRVNTTHHNSDKNAVAYLLKGEHIYLQVGDRLVKIEVLT